MNMGGCMAPAACDTIARNFSDFGRKPSDYDAVFTGDLGSIGQKFSWIFCPNRTSSSHPFIKTAES